MVNFTRTSVNDKFYNYYTLRSLSRFHICVIPAWPESFFPILNKSEEFPPWRVVPAPHFPKGGDYKIHYSEDSVADIFLNASAIANQSSATSRRDSSNSRYKG